jgi:hypothetical protein
MTVASVSGEDWLRVSAQVIAALDGSSTGRS